MANQLFRVFGLNFTNCYLFSAVILRLDRGIQINHCVCGTKLEFLFKNNQLVAKNRTRSLDPAGPTHRIKACAGLDPVSGMTTFRSE